MPTLKTVFDCFEISLPFNFLKAKTPKRMDWDFKVKLVVYYSSDAAGFDFDIEDVNCAFMWTKFIDWDNPALEKYLLAAAKHNFESQFLHPKN